MREAADPDVPLGRVLLQARLVSSELRSPELSEWVKLELNGYPNRQSLPDYRILRPQFFGHFTGGFGRQTKNVPLSTHGFPDDIRDLIAEFIFPDSVSTIEDLIQSNTEFFNYPQDMATLTVFRKCSEQISGQVLNHVVGVIHKTAVAGILHATRSRFLEFLIQLSEEYPDLRTNSDATSTVPADQVAAAARKNIFQDCTFFSTGDQTMGDTYNAQQAGAIGPGAHAHHMSFQQIWTTTEAEIDLPQLATELKALATSMAAEASNPEHQVAIGNVQAAAAAAERGDGPKTIEYLKAAGKWTFDTATKIGIGTAIATIKAVLYPA
ncbi:MAG: hypothetical protein ABJZ55_07285 [Fuerstiella sp.]